MSDDITLLDLDWDLLSHLAIPASYYALQQEQFSDALIEDELVRKVYLWQVKHSRKHGEPANGTVLEDEFDEITINRPQAAIGDLIERLRKRYIRNQGQEKINELVDLTIYDPLTVGTTMITEGKRLTDIVQHRGESYGPEDHDIAVMEYDKAKIAGSGPSFGFPDVDQHFHGQRGVSVLLASPKSYKSWLAINAVLSNQRDGQFPYFYSLELPANDSHWRLKCLAADIPYWKYLHGSLDDRDFKRLASKAEELADLGNYRIEKPAPGERSVTHLMEKALNAGATCVYIDQLQYVESSRGDSLGALNKTGDYFEVLNDLRDYSDRVPVFVVHQFNRTVMGIDGMPEMQQAKGSAAVEEVATMALASWANKDMRASNILHLGVNFSRHHPHATWEVGVNLSRGCEFTLNGAVT
jgi:replicative DNA helicase